MKALTPQPVSIALIGDFCPRGASQEALVSGRTAEVFAPLVIDLLARADLTIANLECPLTHHIAPIPKWGAHLRADPRCAEAMRSIGINVASLANNHIMDMGAEGLAGTIAACTDAGLQTVGAGRNLAEASEPLLLCLRGIKIAVLAVTEHEFSIAGAHRPGASPLDLALNYSRLSQARSESDFVLVIVHGGNEYYPPPSPRLARTCRSLVDMGANAVVCHHTHVPSGSETYRGTPIVYGTGNFLFDLPGPHPPGWDSGYLVQISALPGVAESVELVPLKQNRQTPLVDVMDEAEAAKLRGEFDRLCALISDSDALEREWDQHCRKYAIAYLSAALSLSKAEQLLLNRGFWPSWRLRKAELPRLLNLMHCEAHLDAITTILEDEVAGLDGYGRRGRAGIARGWS